MWLPASVSVTEVLIGLAVFCLLFLVLQTFRKQIPQGLKRIPGPRGYPLIGNLLEVGTDVHLSLTQMSKTYGDVMMIHLGTKPILVLSGLETIKEALVRHGEDFKGRPDLHTFRHVADGQSLSFSTDSGPVWVARRKLAQHALKTFASSPSLTSSSTCLLEDHVYEEAHHLMAKLQEVMLAKNRLDPYLYLTIAVANVVLAMCFGRRYDYDDEELLTIVINSEQFVESTGSGSLATFIPVLQYLPNSKMKKFKNYNRQFTRFLQKNVQEHYESFRKDHIRDITDSLIEESQKQKADTKAKIQLPAGKIVNLVNDIFGAGFSTVSTGLSWCLMYLIAYPEIQKKIQEEIDVTIGRERKPRLSDRSLLPYTEAFILEVFRHSTFVPFTLPHCTTRDTIFKGYFVPKDLCIFINQWQVNHDENLWKDPSAFVPERFLTASGKEINVDEREKVLLFGLGKRRCIGEPIARREVFLFLATLLQDLQFSVPDGVTVNMTPLYGLSLRHERCEHVQVKQRFPDKTD
ncbi:cytochrome P450 1A5-like [Pseudonaja textilis]|uniref:Cytochrome P450 1A n=1 Tax=Pseudonaja textilis TaxID=8673 RepID=A0A670ZC62_PSETE|nr:cytochrome P450 1A5-like [Pseudonaja textilis]XP_026565559.1 cytochrome P450 1A5-like [Pseudonaja textilis]